MRTGRPKLPVGERRDKIIRVRLTEIQRADLEARAAELGITLTELLRRAALGEGLHG